ncbi:hypothetical protein GOP47_0008422 [Adiantum capillus-veneris]|uniref:Uncharacterized protein n=1 Tax=Adiantum capillus-veneris TaxID=13818 RepID=A0A9D4ZJP1_ADICA|nr:hypothetical protein GOP47_0008422 [Adiantum capillus-veneris]
MRSKFRCYFEYYWACVFKVEFRTYSSELPIKAVSEVPKGALPAYCRPGFGPVWTLREKYQVNRTYPCKYTPGHLEMVDIGEDLFAKCQSEKVTAFNIFKQAFMALFVSDQWIFSSTSQAGIVLRRALGYISFAVCFSVLVTGFARTVSAIRSLLYGPDSLSNIDKTAAVICLQSFD